MTSPVGLFHILRGFLHRHTRSALAPGGGRRARAQRFGAYLAEEFLPGTEYEGAEILPVARGSNTLLRRLATADGRALVARCFPKQTDRQKGPEHVAVSGILAGAGAPVPALVHADTRYQTLGRYGFDVVIEEWVEGRCPQAEDFHDDALLLALARLLAALHRVESDRAGCPWRKNNPKIPFHVQFHSRRESWIFHHLERCDFPGASPARLQAFRGFLDRHRPDMAAPGPYSLIHGDLQRENLLLTGQEHRPLVVIDFATVRYGFWPWDFVLAYHFVLQEDAALTRRLLDLYCRERPEARMEHLHALWPYLSVWRCLCGAASAARKCRRASRGDDPRLASEVLERRVQSHWQRALRALEFPRFDKPSP